MKLVRYGRPGEERPGLIDAQGKLRDLGGHVDDLDAATLAAGKLAELARVDAASLPEIGGEPRLGAPASTSPTTPPRRATRSPPSRSSS